MSLRRFASLSSGLTVVVVAATGVLGFVSSTRGWVLPVHAIVGFVFVAAVALHIGHNARPLLKAGVDAKRRPSAALLVALGLLAVVGLSTYLQVAPVRAVLAWSETKRAEGQPRKTTYTTIDLAAPGEGPVLEVDLKAGPWFKFFDEKLGFELTPQMAVWIAREDGAYLDTLYVTHSEAKSDYSPARDQELVRRPEALPVWGHARGVRGSDGIFSPTREAPLPDFVTAASPLESAYVVARARTTLRRFVVMAEVSNACDFNDYYSRDAFPGDRVYHGDGYPAQPSAVYRGVVDLDAASRVVVLALAGHGHVSGGDGSIDPDVSHMTTGLRILDRIVVTVRS